MTMMLHSASDAKVLIDIRLNIDVMKNYLSKNVLPGDVGTLPARREVTLALRVHFPHSIR